MSKNETSNKESEKSQVKKRDLTDAELRLLNEKFKQGLEKMKSHPFSVPEDDEDKKS